MWKRGLSCHWFLITDEKVAFEFCGWFCDHWLPLRFSRCILFLIICNLFSDHYVIVGCHYDAWTYGGVDPNSGTAVLMEITKAFDMLLAKGNYVFVGYFTSHFSYRWTPLWLDSAPANALLHEINSVFKGQFQNFPSEADYRPHAYSQIPTRITLKQMTNNSCASIEAGLIKINRNLVSNLILCINRI